jgi:hypothetical protein
VIRQGGGGAILKWAAQRAPRHRRQYERRGSALRPARLRWASRRVLNCETVRCGAAAQSLTNLHAGACLMATSIITASSPPAASGCRCAAVVHVPRRRGHRRGG